MSEALLDVLDAGLERGNPLLQLAKVALENLAPHTLVGEANLDPAQSVRDRLVLLLEALESPVDVVEVPQHLPPKLGDLVARIGEPAAHLGELAAHVGDLPRQIAELAPHVGDLTAHIAKLAPHFGDLPTQIGDLAA